MMNSRIDYNQGVPYINRYSFVIICVVMFGFVAYLFLRQGFKWRNYAFIGLTAATLLAAWLILRPQPGIKADSVEIISQIGRGIPVMVEIQSPY